MKNSEKKYTPWKSAEEMHDTALQWRSMLNFAEDEHRFFEDMLREYTLPIIESELLDKVKTLIQDLERSRREAKKLLTKVQKHQNGLNILLDGEDQPEEEKSYRKEHQNLLPAINQFYNNYKELKREIFKDISGALKRQKQKRLTA